MAIGWLTVLKMVPWGDVIENAPKVATGAKKLWQNVGKKPVAAAPVSPAGEALRDRVAGSGIAAVAGGRVADGRG